MIANLQRKGHRAFTRLRAFDVFALMVIDIESEGIVMGGRRLRLHG